MRYIKTNNENSIIDIFHSFQKEKFDGTELFLDDNTGYKINGKEITNEYGVYIYTYAGQIVAEKTAVEIDSDSYAVSRLKNFYLLQFPGKMVMCFANGHHTWAEIQTAWLNFKSGSNSWTTVTQVENAWVQAQRFLNGKI